MVNTVQEALLTCRSGRASSLALEVRLGMRRGSSSGRDDTMEEMRSCKTGSMDGGYVGKAVQGTGEVKAMDCPRGEDDPPPDGGVHSFTLWNSVQKPRATHFAV